MFVRTVITIRGFKETEVIDNILSIINWHFDMQQAAIKKNDNWLHKVQKDI